jgi:hypothetical protein
MARSTADGRPFRERIRFATEATQFDSYRNRDLLPLARDAGVHALWFGIEDLTATLINKGQKPAQTIELFRLLREHKISPVAMMMFPPASRITRRAHCTVCTTRSSFSTKRVPSAYNAPYTARRLGRASRKPPMRKAESFAASAATSSRNPCAMVTT